MWLLVIGLGLAIGGMAAGLILTPEERYQGETVRLTPPWRRLPFFEGLSEALGSPDRYGQDRLFASLRLESAPDAAQDRGVVGNSNEMVAEVRAALAVKQIIPRAYYVAGSLLSYLVMGAKAGESKADKARKLAWEALKAKDVPEANAFLFMPPSIPGLGNIFVQSVFNRDEPLILGIVAFE